jgi:hypothetical protein
MARYFEDFWLDSNYYRHGYVDDIYEPPFTFNYFLKVEGGQNEIIEYNEGQLVYTKQALNYFINGEKQWSTKPLKPAKEYRLNLGSRPIVIGNRFLYSGKKKLVCYDLGTQQVLWEITDLGLKEIEAKFNKKIYATDDFDSFARVVAYDEKFVYYYGFHGYFRKIDYIKGEIVNLLDIGHFSTPQLVNNGSMFGNIKLINKDDNIGKIKIFNFKENKIILECEVAHSVDFNLGDSFVQNNLLMTRKGYNKYCLELNKNMPLKWERKIECSYLCADKENVYYYADKKLICVSILTGNTVWEKFYADYDFKSLVYPNSCFVDNKYIHGTFRSCGHICIDKNNGDIVYFIAFIDERKWRMENRKGEISNEINSDNTNYYGLNFVTPGKKHIYYSLYEEGEYVRLSPSNKKDS